MPDKLAAEIVLLALRVSELEQVQGAHRALISQHQSIFRTLAQIMEIQRNVDLDSPTGDRPAQDPVPRP